MKKFHYDPETEILTIDFENIKSVDSDVSGNVVVDYDKDGNITRLELMAFSMDEFARVKPHLKRLMLQRV